MRRVTGKVGHLYRAGSRVEGAEVRTRRVAEERTRGTLRPLALATLALIITALLPGWLARAAPLAPPDEPAAPGVVAVGAPTLPAQATAPPGAPARVAAAAVAADDEPRERTVLAVPVAAATRIARVTGRLADSGGFSVAGVHMRAVATDRQA